MHKLELAIKRSHWDPIGIICLCPHSAHRDRDRLQHIEDLCAHVLSTDEETPHWELLAAVRWKNSTQGDGGERNGVAGNMER